MSAATSESQPALLRDDADGIATLTMNRPEQMNLLTSEMLGALGSALDAIAKDTSVRVVVLAAAGKGFCAGHDLKEIRALHEPAKIEALFATCSGVMRAIEALPQPVIARVQGAAAAAGCQLVAQCDLAVASETAKFVTPGVTWGFFCSTPGVAIGRNLQRKHALEMLLTGDVVDASKALAWGLVNRVAPAGAALLDDTLAWLAPLLEGAPLAMRAALEAVRAALSLPLDAGLDAERRGYELCLTSDDRREALRAFAEKRPPVFRGR